MSTRHKQKHDCCDENNHALRIPDGCEDSLDILRAREIDFANVGDSEPVDQDQDARGDRDREG